MSAGGAPSRGRGTLAVVGAVAFGALCCGGAPITVGAIGGVGVGGLVGGVAGALVMGAVVVGLLLFRRARHARRAPGGGAAEDCCIPLPAEPLARERADTR